MTYNLSNIAFPNPLTITSNASFNASAYAQYEKDRQGPYSLGRGNAFAFLSFQQFSSKYRVIAFSLAQQSPTQYLPVRYSNTPPSWLDSRRNAIFSSTAYLATMPRSAKSQSSLGATQPSLCRSRFPAAPSS